MSFARPWIVGVSTSVLLAAVAITPGQKAKPKKLTRVIDFNRDIRPILSEHCFKCHGPDAKFVKGNLRLSERDDATRSRSDGKPIHPGKPEASMVIQRVTSKEPYLVMPPADSGMPRLSASQISLLKEWIRQGAKYEKHWAFVPPKMPAIPTVKNAAWAKNDVDRFVLAKLEATGLKPAPEASKEILLRRASLALTGLSPTADELNAFLTDNAQNAYERAVDRLLASERYGEHQARYWLDAVRYGDTHGLHLDNERAIYPYRDWVVDALNKDLPFDKFALWQVAGDLLPNPTREMRVATGYVRMNPTTNEGGAIEDEFLVKNTFDRVDTTSTVFLGMTVACAKCHDHKYDPISQKDYYSLFAYFNSTKDAPLDGNDLVPPPAIPVPSPEQERAVAAAEKRKSELMAQVDLDAAKAYLASRRVGKVEFGKWEVAGPFVSTSFQAAFGANEKPTEWRPFKLELGKSTPFIGKDNASAYVRTTVTSEQDQEVVFGFGSDDGIKVWLNEKLIHENPALRGVEQATDQVKARLVAGENRLVVKIVNGGGADGIRVVYGSEVETRIAAALKSGDPAKIRETFLRDGEPSAASKEFVAQDEIIAKTMAAVPRTLVAEELEKPRPAYLLDRGEYDRRKGEVKRSLPAVFGTQLAATENNRLGLAKWLVDPKNPLTSRVYVNRIWQQHFGIGLVRTAEDFGNQGEWPINPELLDYLAVKFQKDGYSVKKLHRLLVTSAAFRQSSLVDKVKLEKDPENRLVSRGPRFRLDAEVLRDQVLHASGLLTNRKGGKGFKPYQPAGLWEEITFSGSNTATYTQDMNDGIYRRTLYLFWKRTSPHPVMSTFDAPTREACVVRRPRTNTPLQALVTLNEPAFLEASRKFAERIVKSKSTDLDRMKLGFRIAFSRNPNAKEIQILTNSLSRYQKQFASQPEAAASLLGVGLAPAAKDQDFVDMAAWTLVASTLFNLDEFLTQH